MVSCGLDIWCQKPGPVFFCAPSIWLTQQVGCFRNVLAWGFQGIASKVRALDEGNKQFIVDLNSGETIEFTVEETDNVSSVQSTTCMPSGHPQKELAAQEAGFAVPIVCSAVAPFLQQ